MYFSKLLKESSEAIILKITGLCFFALITLSCTHSKLVSSIVLEDEDYYVRESNLLLFADLSSYGFGSVETKAGEKEYALSSLLDYENASSVEGVTSIPFLDNKKTEVMTRTDADAKPGDSTPVDSLVIVKKFLLTNNGGKCVITQIATYQNWIAAPKAEPLYMPGFSGLLLASDLDGNLLSIAGCSDGRIFAAGLVS